MHRPTGVGLHNQPTQAREPRDRIGTQHVSQSGYDRDEQRTSPSATSLTSAGADGSRRGSIAGNSRIPPDVPSRRDRRPRRSLGLPLELTTVSGPVALHLGRVICRLSEAFTSPGRTWSQDGDDTNRDLARFPMSPSVDPRNSAARCAGSGTVTRAGRIVAGVIRVLASGGWLGDGVDRG